jgi:hypothetical protein
MAKTKWSQIAPKMLGWYFLKAALKAESEVRSLSVLGAGPSVNIGGGYASFGLY